jgi:DNA-binding winged helix-turn-helix (wHTH) protein/TolB-like protein/Flp pilus assembly protein TadD
MDPVAKASVSYRFDDVLVDGNRLRIEKDGQPHKITPRAFDVLVYLIEHRDRIVEKQELFEQIWKESFVTDNALTRTVKEIRQVIGDDADAPRYIETLHKRGYRFIAEVRNIEARTVRETESAAPEQPVAAQIGSQSAFTTEEPVSQAKTGAVKGGSSLSKTKLFGAIIVATGVIAAFSINRVLNKPEQVAGRTIKSIAVLPFKSFGADDADEYLGVGIAETLTTRLSSLKLLTVRPSSAVLKYAASEKETVVAGQELKVDSVLEGSIQRLGERLRVTVRLVSVSDVSLLWADHFDENFTDIFKVEDSISTKVAAALALKLSGEEQRRLIKRDTDNAEAYQLYLKGRFFWNKRTGEGFKLGIVQFKQAVEKDPGYALAYAGLADSYTGLTFYNFAAPNETMPKAREAATNALAIDSTLAEAHASLAHVKVNYDWEWSDAEKEFRLSIELKPDYATAHQWYAIHYLTPTGQLEEAIQEMKRALDLEPTSLVMNTFLGATLYFAGRYDDAIEQCRKTIEMDSNFAVAHWHLGLAYEQKGMFDDAIAELQKAITLSGSSPLIIAALGYAYAKAGKRNEANRILDELQKLSAVRYVSSCELAAIYVALGEREQAFQRLEKA